MLCGPGVTPLHEVAHEDRKGWQCHLDECQLSLALTCESALSMRLIKEMSEDPRGSSLDRPDGLGRSHRDVAPIAQLAEWHS